LSEIIEEKPADTQGDLFLFPEAATLPKEMERSMAEAIDKMLEKEHAWATAELTQKERVLLQVIYVRSQSFKTIAPLYTDFIQRYLENSVPLKRQRSSEMVKIFENAMQYVKISMKEKMQNAITRGL
jgi:UDP-N-acetyl-D-mannosaminuronate dehydrogenase